MATFDDADERLDSISEVSRTSSARVRAEAEKRSLYAVFAKFFDKS